jgi:hypothetical protein
MARTVPDVPTPVGLAPAVAARRGTWRQRLTPLVVALLVAGVVVGWLALAHRGAVSGGGVTFLGRGVERVDDGVKETRYVADAVPGARFSLTSKVLNTGPVPVTLLGLSPSRESVFAWLERISFAPPPPGSDRISITPLETQQHVTLGPGEEAAMVLEFRVPPCTDRVEGKVSQVSTIRLSTRVLGVLRTQVVSVGDLPLAVTNGPVSFADPCAADVDDTF